MASNPHHKGNLALLPAQAPAPTLKVGQLVDVSKDIQPGVKRIGGRARITEAVGHGDSERFCVKYEVEGGSDKGLPLSALTVVKEEAVPLVRTRRSRQAAVQPVTAHEHHTVVAERDRLVQRNSTLKESVANRDAENVRLRNQLKDFQKRRLAAERDKETLVARLEKERVSHQAEQAKVRTHACTHPRTHIHTHTHARARACARAHTHTHTHTHTQPPHPTTHPPTRYCR